MCTLYERIISLCKERGITGGKMCTDMHMSKSTLTDLKMGRQSGLSAQKAQKIASYLNVTVGYLLGEEEISKETEKKNDTLSDIILSLNSDDELLEIVESITKLDSAKRSVLKSFLSTFVSEERQ
jgi:transcriptional regulator with XRE-family HTH domain